MSTPEGKAPDRPRRRPRGRPPAIDRDRIVSAARKLGVEGLTMRAVADELGVSDAALYYHFESRDALISAVVDVNVQAAPFPKDRGQEWQSWMVEFAEALRRILAAHPGSARFAAMSGPVSSEQIRLVARAVGVLQRAGFDEYEAAMIYSLITNFVRQLGSDRRTAGRRSKRGPGHRHALRGGGAGNAARRDHHSPKGGVRLGEDVFRRASSDTESKQSSRESQPGDRCRGEARSTTSYRRREPEGHADQRKRPIPC